MVSIRRLRLLRMSAANQATQATELGQASRKRALDVNLDTTLVTGAGSALTSPPEEHIDQPFPEVKRRKKHRRKVVENQEPCVMRGVYFKNMKWQAAIKVEKKQIHLGTVGSQEEAARLYDRAAFMCGREPNFELAEEDKRELRKLKWDEFLALTRSAINSKKTQRRMGPGNKTSTQDGNSDREVNNRSSPASEEGGLAS